MRNLSWCWQLATPLSSSGVGCTQLRTPGSRRDERAKNSRFDIAAGDDDLAKALAALDVSTPIALGACIRSLRNRENCRFILIVLRDRKRAWRLRRC
jgi:hypothetical protein